MNRLSPGVIRVLMIAAFAAPCTLSVAIAQLAGQPGASGRMGFGARGMAMGNALSAVTTGDMTSYYNPALLPFAESRSGSASMGILGLDRSLNFLSYAMPLPPKAGLAVNIINSGVHDIDGRDGDGEQTGALRTSENMFFLGFGIKFTPEFSAGVNVKLHYYHLYTDVASATVGFDFGAYYLFTPRLGAAVTVRNFSSRYKWDTSTLFGQSGQSSEAPLPQLYTGALSYQLPDSLGVIGAEVEFSNKSSVVARAGVELSILPEFSARAGVDRMDLKEKGNGIKPSVGFTFRQRMSGWTPAVHYAFVIEPFSPADIHVISVSVAF
jgi:hypothetical protein